MNWRVKRLLGDFMRMGEALGVVTTHEQLDQEESEKVAQNEVCQMGSKKE